MKQLAFLLLTCILVGCSDELKIPDVVLPEDKMVEVMTDVQIAESYIKLKFALRSDTIRTSDSIYAAVYRKHKISAATYDTSFQFYTTHPELLQRIYEKAINNLGTIEALNESTKKVSKAPEEELPVDLEMTTED